MKTMQLSSEELAALTEPVEKCQDSIIHLLHPNRKLKLKLLRGGVEKTLRRFGYIEITKEDFEKDDL